jgi:hypothetical protein
VLAGTALATTGQPHLLRMTTEIECKSGVNRMRIMHAALDRPRFKASALFQGATREVSTFQSGANQVRQV